MPGLLRRSSVNGSVYPLAVAVALSRAAHSAA
ncbi:hypothetical protein Deima_1317 [Deinococcus maricopensis DSM 21211]|uniref:Uncharacterized protein n=1 Tax=Deinococcus maricopensis (strain DSM 21211 / LMG 22137 / NRRL B-23946 / LB-34) TaxID=709986 RepID=E8U7C9_DEIML|nr:hypothetical protein Deima_1317 [Deinococcus maricopensis DSM 21211]